MRACPRCMSIYASEVDHCSIDGERLIAKSGDPLVGKTIDRYRVVERLGSGGMGSVYRATHVKLELEYAVKVLFGDVASDRKVLERFEREALALSKMRHPNVVQVFDFGRTEQGLSFLVMELLRGKSVAQVVEDEGAFHPERAARIARQVYSGLDVAHGLGFVHRDLKPANVMLVTGDGGTELAKVLDFGLVGLKNAQGPSLTKTGFTVGTPQYMAPEQVRASRVGPPADIYAAGTILYEMLTGRPPFVGAVHEVMMKHCSEPPPPLPDLQGLDDLTLHLLAKAPEDRPSSAKEVVDALDAWLAGQRPARETSEEVFPRHVGLRAPSVKPSRGSIGGGLSPLAQPLRITGMVPALSLPEVEDEEHAPTVESSPARLIGPLSMPTVPMTGGLDDSPDSEADWMATTAPSSRNTPIVSAQAAGLSLPQTSAEPAEITDPAPSRVPPAAAGAAPAEAPKKSLWPAAVMAIAVVLLGALVTVYALAPDGVVVEAVESPAEPSKSP